MTQTNANAPAPQAPAAAKAPDHIELVAVERGFANGRLYEPGAKFMFRVTGADGKPRKLPKWAQPADKPVVRKPAAQAGDLKPKETQQAVAAKAGQIAAGVAGGGPAPLA